MNPGSGNGLEIYRTQQRPRHVRLSSDLDLDSAGGSGSSNSDRASHYTPLTTPIVIETTLQTGNGSSNVAMDPNIGPICASSPKRSMSAFTTFGPTSRSNVSTPMSPPPPMPPTQVGGSTTSGPQSGHLV